MAIDGEYAIVGAQEFMHKGCALVFHYNGTKWERIAVLTASDGAAEDFFGSSVSISGDNIVVGAYRDDDSRGSAYVFEKPAEGWSDMTETVKLKASDGTKDDRFGCSTGISGNQIVVGAYWADGEDIYSGAAYFFKQNSAPTIENAIFNIKDSSEKGTLAGTVSVSDEDGDAITYSITGGDDKNVFAIDTLTGEITLTGDNLLDCGTAPQYTLIVEVSDGELTNSATVTINIVCISGVNENSIKEVICYPNPVTNTLNVSIGKQSYSQVYIMDVTGKILLKATEIQQIDVSGLSSGLYTISVVFEGKIVTGKFVKR